jgi:hypothetical protein
MSGYLNDYDRIERIGVGAGVAMPISKLRAARVALAMMSLALTSCASPHTASNAPAVKFSPPPGFINVNTASAGTTSYVNFATHERIGLDTKTQTPPPDAPPGQHVARFTACNNLPVVLWESPHGRETWVRYYVPEPDGAYFFVVYTRPAGTAASPSVMHSMTTACP